MALTSKGRLHEVIIAGSLGAGRGWAGGRVGRGGGFYVWSGNGRVRGHEGARCATNGDHGRRDVGCVSGRITGRYCARPSGGCVRCWVEVVGERRERGSEVAWMLERVKRDKRCSSVRSDWASEDTGGWGHAGTMASAGGGHGRTPCGECARCPRAGTAGGPERVVERLARAFR